ncbi:MAG: hypothetical protein Q8T09_02395 [Candidatus Melainabacteria bacterium]|nr:hypothetical protein [Candidatus Melainabacteria bacterium]
MPIEIELDSTLFRVHHYQTVHAVASCKFGAQVCLGIGLLATCARLPSMVTTSQVLQFALAAMLAIAVLQLPGFFSLSVKILTQECSSCCQSESLDINTLWQPFYILAALALNFTGVPVLLHFLGIGLGTVLGILIPFIVASCIFWLPVASGRAAQLEIEAKELR